MKYPFSSLFSKKTTIPISQDIVNQIQDSELLEEDTDKLRNDLEFVNEETTTSKIKAEADRKIRSAAVQSVSRLHVLQQGRCPKCGASLNQNVFVSVCEECGWHSYSVPRQGSICVHTKNRAEGIMGEKCHVLKNGEVLVLNGDVVTARIPSSSVEWVEYLWGENEVSARRSAIKERLSLPCGWCGKETTPDTEGFHLVHAAFGSTQERFCFCCDECYEAFKQMYPSRVHRNCYETSCEKCNECMKRYTDEAEGLRTLAKDLITINKMRNKARACPQKKQNHFFNPRNYHYCCYSGLCHQGSTQGNCCWLHYYCRIC